MQRAGFLQLRYGRGKVIEPFLSRLFTESHLRTVYWISPWITHVRFRVATTTKLLHRFSRHRVNLIVITRQPDPGSLHEEFVRDVKELPTASIFYMPLLHAKFYVAVTSERRYALIGSANMYEWSSRSYDMGVVIEARGKGEVLVDKLEQLAIDLRVTNHTAKA